jgi:hypothetical protein
MKNKLNKVVVGLLMGFSIYRYQPFYTLAGVQYHVVQLPKVYLTREFCEIELSNTPKINGLVYQCERN